MTSIKKLYPGLIFRKLASLQLAIGLLFVIGILISIGTIIEQDQSLLFYQENYPETAPLFNFLDWKLITSLNLNKLYTTSWFLIILFFFASSLLSCTFTTQLPALKKFRLWKFTSTVPQLKKLPIKDRLGRNLTNIAMYNLHGNNFHIFRQSKKNYAYTGLLGRIGPIIVHFSILLLLVGTSWGSLTGYTVQELVPRGEVFHLQNLIKTGPLSYISQQFSLRVNDFWITYTDDKKTNQFYSDISALDPQGSESRRKTVFVNEPFSYRGLTIYQTDWSILGLKIQYNDNPIVQIPLKKITGSGKTFWLGLLEINDKNVDKLTVLVNDLTGSVYLYNVQGQLIQNADIGDKVSLKNNTTLQVHEFITTTGLQIKQDPGIKIIYTSFFLLMFSIYLSFLSYSQIWGIEKRDDFFLAGKANRAVLAFQEDFKNFLRQTK